MFVPGTERTWLDVQLKSAMRSKGDILPLHVPGAIGHALEFTLASLCDGDPLRPVTSADAK